MSQTPPNDQDPYAAAGVNTVRGDELVEWLQAEGKDSTPKNPFGEVLDGIGGFAGLFRPSFGSLNKPVLVASTDGIGTKLILGIESNLLEGLGQDLVAMCINDLYCCGAQPLFFLDYFATGVLEKDQFQRVLKSIKSALNKCGTQLLGGETAEMPGLYQRGHFDLAGFVVGVVDQEKMRGIQHVRTGDVLIGMSSSGFHSNGYSLLRKWHGAKPWDDILMENVMKPTEIYHFLPEVFSRFAPDKFHALAHITGGGISGNLERIIPQTLQAWIDAKQIPTPSWMKSLMSDHGYKAYDLEGIFNLGVGMIAAVCPQAAPEIVEAISRHVPTSILGTVRQRVGTKPVEYKL